MLLENGMEVEENTIDGLCFVKECIPRSFQIPQICKRRNFLRFLYLLLSLSIAIDFLFWLFFLKETKWVFVGLWLVHLLELYHAHRQKNEQNSYVEIGFWTVVRLIHHIGDLFLNTTQLITITISAKLKLYYMNILGYLLRVKSSNVKSPNVFFIFLETNDI